MGTDVMDGSKEVNVLWNYEPEITLKFVKEHRYKIQCVNWQTFKVLQSFLYFCILFCDGIN